MISESKVHWKGRKRGRGLASRGLEVSFGSYGLKSLGYGWLTARQIEATRRVLTQFLKKGGKIWIRVFPDKPVTRKDPEVPMGGGKGSPEFFVAVIKPGTIMFEIEGVSEAVAKEAMRLAGFKLPVKTKFVIKK